MSERIHHSGLQIAKPIFDLVAQEVCPGSGIEADNFWPDFAAIIRDLAPINRQLLEKRESLQATIDGWHRERKGSFVFSDYKAFLQEIGYLVPDVGNV
jgi:malate synthase